MSDASRLLSSHGLRPVLFAVVALGYVVLAFADPVTDLKAIAGKWTGHGRSPVGTNPLEWTINPDGKVDVVAATPTGPIKGVARVWLKDGKIHYESATSSGTLSVQGRGGDRDPCTGSAGSTSGGDGPRDRESSLVRIHPRAAGRAAGRDGATVARLHVTATADQTSMI